MVLYYFYFQYAADFEGRNYNDRTEFWSLYKQLSQ